MVSKHRMEESDVYAATLLIIYVRRKRPDDASRLAAGKPTNTRLATHRILLIFPSLLHPHAIHFSSVHSDFFLRLPLRKYWR